MTKTKNHTNQMATHVFQFTCFIPVAAATFQFSAAAILCYQDIQVRELVVSCWRRLAGQGIFISISEKFAFQ